MPLPDFHVSEPFTLGIELEMQVVNPPGYDLSQDSSMLIDTVKNQITAGEVKHDITESMLELATDVCRDINQAAGQFSAMQKVVLQAAADHHLEINEWNRQQGSTESVLNLRRMTNIGTFRAYLNEYLRNHPRIRKDMTLMVRQLAPGDNGLPLEIYAFTNTVVWLEYESIQADIFDHIFAIVEEFGLRLHQSPTGNDIRSLAGAFKQ